MADKKPLFLSNGEFVEANTELISSGVASVNMKHINQSVLNGVSDIDFVDTITTVDENVTGEAGISLGASGLGSSFESAPAIFCNDVDIVKIKDCHLKLPDDSYFKSIGEIQAIMSNDNYRPQETIIATSGQTTFSYSDIEIQKLADIGLTKTNVPDDLFLYWPNGSPVDRSLNHIPINATAGMSYNTSIFKTETYSSFLSGASSYMRIANSYLNSQGFGNIDQPFTLDFWYYSVYPGHSNDYYLWDTRSTSGAAGFLCLIQPSNGVLNFGLYDGTGSIYVRSPSLVSNGNWYHVVFVYDGSGDASGCTLKVNDTSQTLTVDSNNLTGNFTGSGTYCYFGTYAGNIALAELKGYLSTACLWKKVLTASEITARYNSGNGALVDVEENEFKKADLIMHMDDNFDDSAGNFTPIGYNVTLSSTNKLGVTSVQFPNSYSSYIDAGQALAKHIYEPFTIEFWAYCDSTASSAYPWFYSNQSTSSTLQGISLYFQQSTRTVYANLPNNNGSTIRLLVSTGSSAFSFDTWNHFAFRYKGYGCAEDVDIFINGVKQTLSTLTNTLLGREFYFTNPANLGRATYNSGYYMKGFMDEFIIHNYALSDYQIENRYNSGNGLRKEPDIELRKYYNDPLTDDLALYWPNGSPVDRSPNLIPINAVSGMSFSTAIYVTETYSSYLNGSSSYMRILNSYLNNQNFGKLNQPFTLDFWIYPVSGNANPYIIDTRNQAVGAAGFMSSFITSNNSFRFYFQDSSSNASILDSEASIWNYNNWHHVVFIYDGVDVLSSRLFINDVEKTLGVTQNDLVGDFTGSGTYCYFGDGGSVLGTAEFKGYFSTTCIHKKVLTSSEITARYNSGNGALIDTQSTDDKVASLIMHMDKSVVDETYNFTPIGYGVTFPESQKKLGLTSAQFTDTSSTYIDVGQALAKHVYDPFTIEFWAYCDSTGSASNTYLLSNSGAATAYKGINFYYNNSTRTLYANFSFNNGTSQRLYVSSATAAFNYNQWNHFALRYKGYGSAEDIDIFVNGTKLTLTTVNNAILGQDFYSTVAGYLARATFNTSYHLKGFMDEFVIHNYALTDSQITARYNSGSGAIKYKDNPEEYNVVKLTNGITENIGVKAQVVEKASQWYYLYVSDNHSLFPNFVFFDVVAPNEFGFHPNISFNARFVSSCYNGSSSDLWKYIKTDDFVSIGQTTTELDIGSIQFDSTFSYKDYKDKFPRTARDVMIGTNTTAGTYNRFQGLGGANTAYNDVYPHQNILPIAGNRNLGGINSGSNSSTQYLLGYIEDIQNPLIEEVY